MFNIKKPKIVNKSKHYIVAISLLLILLVSPILLIQESVSAASTGACYDYFAGVTYKCGPGSFSPCTPYPIYTSSTQTNPISPGCKGDVNSFAFAQGQCYTFDDVPANGLPGWIQATDCSASVYQNPSNNIIPSTLAASDSQKGQDNCSNVGGTQNCSLFGKYINPLIKFLSYAVGIIVVISIVIGGIQFSASGDNPQAAAAAKKRIVGALIAAVTYVFLIAILNFVLPGS